MQTPHVLQLLGQLSRRWWTHGAPEHQPVDGLLSACVEDLVGPALGFEKSTVGHRVVWTIKE
jgi:hypothetical protein